MVPVPNNMTSYFPPLDLTVNRSFKKYCTELYSQQVQAQINKDIPPKTVSVELKLSILKAKWIVQFCDYESKSTISLQMDGSERE